MMPTSLRNILANTWLQTTLRFVLGFIFVYAAIEKIAQPEEFAKAIMNYRILPIPSVNIAALVLPWVELLTGLALIGRVYVRSSSLLIIGMLVVFCIAIAAALIRGLDISCGCFGTAVASKVGWSRLIEDLAMLVGAGIVYFFSRRTAAGSPNPS